MPGLPQHATPRRGFESDVTSSPIDTKLFQILKILVGGFFTTPLVGGALIEKQK